MYFRHIFLSAFLIFFPNLAECSYFDEQTVFHIEWPGKAKTPGFEKSRAEENIYVATRNNENYVCYTPKDKEETEAKDLRDSFLPLPSEISLLKPLFEKDVCVTKVTSYWTYELCHGKHLRQYHKEESVIKVASSTVISEGATSQYVLGRYKEPDWRNQKLLKERYKANEKPSTYRFSRVELPYFPVDLDPGEVCDLTQQPRQVRVLYFCQPDTKAEIYDILEVSTCSYELLVFTSYLCENKKYRATLPSKEVGVECYANDEKTPKLPTDLVKFHPAPPRYRDIFGRNPKSANKKPNEEDDEDDEDEFVDDFWIMDQFGVGPVPDLDADDPFSKYGRKVEKMKGRKHFEGHEHSKFLVKPPDPAKPLITDFQHVRDFLRGTYCLHGGMPGGWWRYELCFGQWARQYHEEVVQERKTSRTEISLGFWRAEKHVKWLAGNPSKRPRKPANQRKSVTYLYGDGDVCDATGLARQTIVKLTCNPSDASEAIGISLSEPSTCVYEIDVIAGNWLCTVVRAADDDGIFDLETVIASLSGSDNSPSSSVSPETSDSSATTTTPAPQIVEPTPTPAPPIQAATSTESPVTIGTRPPHEMRSAQTTTTESTPKAEKTQKAEVK